MTFQELAEEEHDYCSWILAQNDTNNMRMNKLQAFLRNLSKLKEQRSEVLKESQAPVRSAVTTALASHPVSAPAAPSRVPARALLNEESVRAEAVRTTARPLAQSATVAAVSKLLSMGFEEEDAVRALAEAGNNLEAAVALLTEPPEIPRPTEAAAAEAEVPEVLPSPPRPRAPPAAPAPPSAAPAPARVVRSPALQPPVETQREPAVKIKATICCDDSSDSDVQIAFD